MKHTFIEVVKSQKRLLNYNGFYNAFLMGQLSEEEFIEISKKFAYKPKPVKNINKLANKVRLLLDIAKIDFSTAELSDIFQCTTQDVMKAIGSINPNYIEAEASQ